MYQCRSWACRRPGTRTAPGWALRWSHSAAGHCSRWSYGPSRRPCAHGESDTCGVLCRKRGLPTDSPVRHSADVCRWTPLRRKETSGTAPNQTDDSRTARGCHEDLREEQTLPSMFFYSLMTKTLQPNSNGLSAETNSPSIILEFSVSWGGFRENHEDRTSAGTVAKLLLDRSR